MTLHHPQAHQRGIMTGILFSALLLITLDSVADQPPVPAFDLRLEAGQLSGRYQGTVGELLTSLTNLIDMRVKIAPGLSELPLQREITALPPQQAVRTLLADFNTVITTDPDRVMRVFVLGSHLNYSRQWPNNAPATAPNTAALSPSTEVPSTPDHPEIWPMDLEPEIIEQFYVANRQPPLSPEEAVLFAGDTSMFDLPPEIQEQFDIAQDYATNEDFLERTAVPMAPVRERVKLER